MRNPQRTSRTASAPGKASAEDESLTPHARRALASSGLLAALDEYLRTFLVGSSLEDQWIDQHASPLGRRAHLDAVRRGDLQGVKHGRRILVRRSELNSFLESRSVKHHSVTGSADASIDEKRVGELAAAVLTSVGFRQRKV